MPAYCKIQIAMKCKFHSRNLYWAILFPEISPPLISLLGEIPLGLKHLFRGFLYSPHLLTSPLQAEDVAGLPAGPSRGGAAAAPALPRGAQRVSKLPFGIGTELQTRQMHGSLFPGTCARSAFPG